MSTTTSKGILGTKLGMTQIFDENARVVPVTVIQAGPCTVAQLKSPEREHRSPGSVGACATPGRIFKGLRMSGHMGHERVTVLNLQVVKVDPDRNLLLVRGAVPGPKRGLVMLRSSVRARGKEVRG